MRWGGGGGAPVRDLVGGGGGGGLASGGGVAPVPSNLGGVVKTPSPSPKGGSKGKNHSRNAEIMKVKLHHSRSTNY